MSVTQRRLKLFESCFRELKVTTSRIRKRCGHLHSLETSKDLFLLRSQALLEVASSAERIILISGTPVLNSAMELYPLLRLLDRNIQCQQAFARRYFQARTLDFGKLKYTDPQG